MIDSIYHMTLKILKIAFLARKRQDFARARLTQR